MAPAVESCLAGRPVNLKNARRRLAVSPEMAGARNCNGGSTSVLVAGVQRHLPASSTLELLHHVVCAELAGPRGRVGGSGPVPHRGLRELQTEM